MNLTRNLSSGTISNGKYVNSGKRIQSLDPAHGTTQATKSVGQHLIKYTKCRLVVCTYSSWRGKVTNNRLQKLLPVTINVLNYHILLDNVVQGHAI